MLLPSTAPYKNRYLIGVLFSIGLICYPFTFALAKTKDSPINRIGPVRVSDAFGVNYTFPDPHPEAHHMEILAASGVRWVRMDMAWSYVEKEKGKYNFDVYDQIFNVFARYNLRPLVVLASHGQSNYPTKSGRFPNPPDTIEAQEAFTNWVVAVIQRYKGRGIVWEVYNEPDNPHFWPPEPNAEDYSRLAVMVGKAVRQIAPKELLVGPALISQNYPYLEEVLKSGVLKYWDAISVHPYRAAQHPETVSEDYLKYRQLMRRYKSSKAVVPVISGEWGYPSKDWEGASFDEEKQSRFLARQWLTNLSNRIAISIWFSWCDGDCLQGKSNDIYDHFGLVRSPGTRSRNSQINVKNRLMPKLPLKQRASKKGSVYRPLSRMTGVNPKTFSMHRTLPRTTTFEPKLSYFAARTLTTVFKDYTFDRQLKVTVPDIYLLRFRPPRKNQAPGFAVWSVSNQPRAVTLPLPAGDYQVTSHLGDDLGTTNSQGGSTIEVTDSPLYLVKK
jgi:polysaccharide biosynthesis protein PslG